MFIGFWALVKCLPAFANSTSSLGKVAENSRVCLQQKFHSTIIIMYESMT